MRPRLARYRAYGRRRRDSTEPVLGTAVGTFTVAGEKLVGVPPRRGDQVLALHQRLDCGQEAPSLIVEVGLQILHEARAHLGFAVLAAHVQSAPDEPPLVAHERRTGLGKPPSRTLDRAKKEPFLSRREADEALGESSDGVGPFGRASRERLGSANFRFEARGAIDEPCNETLGHDSLERTVCKCDARAAIGRRFAD